MIKGLLVLIVFLSAASNANSQNWHILYNGLYLSHFEELSNHEIILTGSSFGFSSPDSTNIILIKADTVGNVVWSKGYGSVHYDYGSDVKQCRDSGFVIAGYTNGFNSESNDVVLLKTDKQGNVEWSRAYGGDSTDEAYVVKQTEDNGFIVGGHTHSLTSIPGSRDFFLLKSDSSGDVQWVKTYGDVANNNFSDLKIMSDSSYLILGMTGNFSGYGFFNFYLMKVDRQGQLVWQRGFGSAFEDYAAKCVQTYDEGFVVCGTTWESDADILVVKTDASGTIEWSKKYGSGSDNNFAYDIIQLNDSGYFVIGGTWPLGESLITIIRLDKNGDMLWTKTDSEYQWDQGTQIKSTTGGFLVQTESFLFKMDSLGLSDCNDRQYNYTYTNATTSNYTIFPTTSTPYWQSNRVITMDTLIGITSSPGCNSTGINFEMINHTNLYPNPATEKLYVINQNVNNRIEVFNLLGAKMNVTIVNKNTENLEIDVSGLKQGVYILRQNFPETTTTKLFIKQ